MAGVAALALLGGQQVAERAWHQVLLEAFVMVVLFIVIKHR